MSRSLVACYPHGVARGKADGDRQKGGGKPVLTEEAGGHRWAGEELGLLGSKHYVESVVAAGGDGDIALNLNFDMIASPNFQRGVYNGTDPSSQSEGALQASTYIMRMFESHFDSVQLPHVPTPFTGR